MKTFYNKESRFFELHRNDAHLFAPGTDGDMLQIHHDLDDILAHARNGAEFVQ